MGKIRFSILQKEILEMKKWQKTSLFSFIGIVVLILGGVIYMLFFFELFPLHKQLLMTTFVPAMNYNINAYYVDSGATSNGAIQLYKVSTSGKSELIKNIPTYQDVKEMKILSDSKLRVVVGFKGNFSTKQDTIFIELK